MTNKIIGLLVLSGVMAMLSGICEYAYFGETETTRLTVLLTAPNFGESLGIFGTITFMADFAWSWFSNLFGILTFNYSFFEGEWQIVRYILFIPLGVGIIAAIVAMVRGTNA